MESACIFVYKQMKKQKVRFKGLGPIRTHYHVAFLTASAALGFMGSGGYGVQRKRIHAAKSALALGHLLCFIQFGTSDFKKGIEKLMPLTQEIIMFRKNVREKGYFLESSKVLGYRREVRFFFYIVP